MYNAMFLKGLNRDSKISIMVTFNNFDSTVCSKQASDILLLVETFSHNIEVFSKPNCLFTSFRTNAVVV